LKNANPKLDINYSRYGYYGGVCIKKSFFNLKFIFHSFILTILIPVASMYKIHFSIPRMNFYLVYSFGLGY
jgi:hypothetical protein